jgi:hypothetical protein
MRQARSLGRYALVPLALTLLAGCASVPAVTSIEPLVGHWAGTLDLGGPLIPFYLTVKPDQTIVATWALNWANGRITIANGRATYQMTPPPQEGTIRFYQGNGKPTIYMDDLFLSFHAVVTPR